MQGKGEVIESQTEEATNDEDTDGEGEENINAETDELVDTGKGTKMKND